MGEDWVARQRRSLNRLTVLKLGLQLLERKTELSDRQRDLVRKTLGAAEGLTTDLLDQWRAERDLVADRGAS